MTTAHISYTFHSPTAETHANNLNVEYTRDRVVGMIVDATEKGMNIALQRFEAMRTENGINNTEIQVKGVDVVGDEKLAADLHVQLKGWVDLMSPLNFFKTRNPHPASVVTEIQN